MFIDPDILKTATFLIVDDEPCSTVFFVRWFLGNGLYTYYAVTTRHSIQSPIVSIRFNLYGGTTQDQFFSRGDWVEYLPSDIAILPLDIALNSYDVRYLDTWNFARNKDYLREVALSPISEGRIFSLRYGAGDEIYTLGLFEGHTGQHLAQPVVRFGHIALKPAEGEQILAEIDPPNLTPIDAFLVEMATWQGQSGSPVFLHVPAALDDQIAPPYAQETNYLIGMVQGFYPGYQDVQIDGQDATLSPLQMGIGIVIPAKDIGEALSQQPLERSEERRVGKKQQNPTIRPSAVSINKKC